MIKSKKYKTLLLVGAGALVTASIATPVALITKQNKLLPEAETLANSSYQSSEIDSSMQIVDSNSTGFIDLDEANIIDLDVTNNADLFAKTAVQTTKIKPETRKDAFHESELIRWVNEDFQKVRDFGVNLPSLRKMKFNYGSPQFEKNKTYWWTDVLDTMRKYGVNLYDYGYPSPKRYTSASGNYWQEVGRQMKFKRVDRKTGTLYFDTASFMTSGPPNAWTVVRRTYLDTPFKIGWTYDDWKWDQEKEEVLKHINGQIEYDQEKFAKISGKTLYLDRGASKFTELPAKGTNIGGTSKLDENRDGKYTFSNDYRYNGLIGKNWVFKYDGKLQKLDKIVGPSTWQTKRSFKVVDVNTRDNIAKIEVSIYNPRYKEAKTLKEYFYIDSFISEKGQIEFDREKMDKIAGKTLTLTNDIWAPEKKFLGFSSKLDENNDGTFKYDDDYKLGGIIHDWTFYMPDSKTPQTLNQIVGPSTWLTQREYNISTIDTKGNMTVDVSIYNKDKSQKESFKFTIADFNNYVKFADAIAFEKEKLDKFYNEPIYVAGNPKLPAVGEYLGFSQKFDRNGDGVYKYKDDYRLGGKMYEYKFKKSKTSSETFSFDHMTTPSTWLTGRDYIVKEVDKRYGIATIQILILSPDRKQKDYAHLKIWGFDW